MTDNKYICVENLKKRYVYRNFFGKKFIYEPIKNVSFTVAEGESVGLSGPSGCGKSTVARIILKLIEKTSGSVTVEGKNIDILKGEELIRFRRKCQIVFQDPYSSLTPVMNVGELIKEAVVFHKITEKNKAEKYVKSIFDRCGLTGSAYSKRPAEFSGGQRQRIAVARALALKPSFIVADEPVSALDPSVQAQILNLFKDLQEEEKLTLLFVSHDKDVLNFMCDRIVEIKEGKVLSL